MLLLQTRRRRHAAIDDNTRQHYTLTLALPASGSPIRASRALHAGAVERPNCRLLLRRATGHEQSASAAKGLLFSFERSPPRPSSSSSSAATTVAAAFPPHAQPAACVAMWLDRLSHSGGASPQNNGSRSVSPMPRRPSGASRGPYMTSQRSARASSLSLLSNDSTSSLLTSRKQDGSSLRQSTSATTPTPGDNKARDEAALALLGRLIGASPRNSLAEDSADEDQEVLEITDEDLEGDYDFGGLTLRELASESAAARQSYQHSSRSPEDCMFGRGRVSPFFFFSFLDPSANISLPSPPLQ